MKLVRSMKMPSAKYPRSLAGSALRNIREEAVAHEDSDQAA